MVVFGRGCEEGEEEDGGGEDEIHFLGVWCGGFLGGLYG